MSRVEQAVTQSEANMRLDRWCNQHLPALTHGQLEKFLRKKVIRRNGGKAVSNDRLVEGDIIGFPEWCTQLPEAAEQAVQPTISVQEARANLKALQLFANKDIVVLNKPSGLAVQGGSGVRESVDGWLQAVGDHWKLVHRLDKDTSGLLVLAKTSDAARQLTAGFRSRKIEKTYWALVKYLPELVAGKIDLPLGTGGGKVEKTVVDTENGLKARTRYEIIEKLGDEFAWLALYPETGRKHQLRVHLAEIGHPIIGDGKYGGAEAHVDGLASNLHLHARALDLREIFPHVPVLIAPLTGPMQKSWKTLGLDTEYE